MRRAPLVLLSSFSTLASNAALAGATTGAAYAVPNASRPVLSFLDSCVDAPAAGEDFDSGDSGLGGSVVA